MTVKDIDSMSFDELKMNLSSLENDDGSYFRTGKTNPGL